MPLYLLCYGLTLAIFLAFDAVWLGSTNQVLYKQALGDVLAERVRLVPAVVFYLVYPIGLVVFAQAPALKADSFLPALGYGALFGAMAYATYDLTNFATLRNWNWQVTILDLLWGTFLSGIATMLAFFATRALGRSLGWL